MTAQSPPGLILAGGKSSRMGSDKALLPFGTGTLLSRIAERLMPQVSELAVNAPPSLTLPHGLRRVPDGMPGQPGPLAGVLAGLQDVTRRKPGQTHLLTVPSDAPFFPENLSRRLISAATEPEAVVIASSAGRAHPVFGLWPLSIASDLQLWLADSGNRRLMTFMERHKVIEVEWQVIPTDIGPLDPFMNVNTPEDLEGARRFLEIPH